MNKIIYLILFSILGILLYQILSNICECKLTEGYGEFGRVNLDKCCPRGYKYSKTMKKCVEICDACGPSVYNKLKYEFKKYLGDSKRQLRAYFDCDEHDASTVYGYDSINRRYTKDDLLYNRDYGGWNMNSDFFTASVPSASGVEDSTDGVEAAEEGSNETWSGISTDADDRAVATDTADVNTEQQHHFDEIPEELYYTSREECIDDYTNFSSIPNKGNPPEAPGLYENGTIVDNPDCRGYWKLDMEDQRFDYLKDGDRSIAQPSWRVYTKESGSSRHPGYIQSFGSRGRQPTDPTFQENRDANLPMIYRYINDDILNTTSPIYEYYLNNFLKLRCIDSDDTEVYPTPGISCPEQTENPEDEEREVITETLNNNRTNFCNNLSRQIIVLSNGDADGMNQLKSTSFVNNGDHNYNTVCSQDDDDSLTTNSINEWDRLCRETSISFDTNNDWNRGGGDNTINILCNIETDTGKLCPNSSGLDVEPTKTFCST